MERPFPTLITPTLQAIIHEKGERPFIFPKSCIINLQVRIIAIY